MMQFSLSPWPRWALMWTMAAAVYAGCKWLTWQQAAVRDVRAWKHAAYLLTWPGLDAASFLGEELISNCWPCRSLEWLAAAGNLTFGVVLLLPLMVGAWRDGVNWTKG